MNLTTSLWIRPKTCNSEPGLGCCLPFAPDEIISAKVMLGQISLSLLLCVGWKRLVTSRTKVASLWTLLSAHMMSCRPCR